MHDQYLSHEHTFRKTSRIRQEINEHFNHYQTLHIILWNRNEGVS